MQMLTISKIITPTKYELKKIYLSYSLALCERIVLLDAITKSSALFR